MKDISFEDFEYFEVQEDGSQVKIGSFVASTDKVYIVVDHKARIISLWKGAKAPIRLKFIGSRASGDTRKEVGYHYKLDVQDQGDEDKSFLERILGDAGAKTGEKAAELDDTPETFTSYSAAAEAQGISVSDDEVRELKQADQAGPLSKMGGIGQRPQASFLAGGFMDASSGKKVSKKQITNAVQMDSKQEAQKILEELGEPKGFSREMVVVGSSVYRVVKQGDILDFQELDNPLDGIIMIKEYTPRIVAENGIVKAIELLRQTSDEIEEDEMITQDLADLTAMFQIEIG